MLVVSVVFGIVDKQSEILGFAYHIEGIAQLKFEIKGGVGFATQQKDDILLRTKIANASAGVFGVVFLVGEHLRSGWVNGYQRNGVAKGVLKSDSVHAIIGHNHDFARGEHQIGKFVVDTFCSFFALN